MEVLLQRCIRSDTHRLLRLFRSDLGDWTNGLSERRESTQSAGSKGSLVKLTSVSIRAWLPCTLCAECIIGL